MNKMTNNFIENAGKSTEKEIEFINPNDKDLDINLGEGCLFVAIVCAIWFITYMVA
jgi:hypothetical protein